MEFSNKTDLSLTQGLSTAAAVDAVGDAYVTPAALRRRLEDLARLSYLSAKFFYRLRLSAQPAAGVADIELRAGSTIVATQTVTLSTAAEHFGAVEFDPSSIAGVTDLAAAINVTTAADAGTTAELASSLEVVHPVVIAGRC